MRDLTSTVYNFKSKSYSEWDEMLDMVAEIASEVGPAFAEMATHMADLSHEQDADTMLRFFMIRVETAARHRFDNPVIEETAETSSPAQSCEHGPCCN
jgi:hypothetical protein